MEHHCNAKIDNREPKVVIIVSRDLLQQQFMQHFMQHFSHFLDFYSPVLDLYLRGILFLILIIYYLLKMRK